MESPWGWVSVPHALSGMNIKSPALSGVCIWSHIEPAHRCKGIQSIPRGSSQAIALQMRRDGQAIAQQSLRGPGLREASARAGGRLRGIHEKCGGASNYQGWLLPGEPGNCRIRPESPQSILQTTQPGPER